MLKQPNCDMRESAFVVENQYQDFGRPNQITHEAHTERERIKWNERKKHRKCESHSQEQKDWIKLLDKCVD